MVCIPRDGEIALVTGASSGLGRLLAEGLRARGWTVAVTARETARLPQGEGFLPCAVDLTDMEATRAFAERLEKEHACTLLVNNAGSGLCGPLEATSATQLDAQLTLLLRAPALLTQTLWPGMVARRRGAFVNVSSLGGEFPLPGMPAYNAAKAGLAAFTRTLLYEAPLHGLQVLDVRPGDFASAAGMHPASEPEEARWARVRQHLNAQIAAGTPPERVARAILRALDSGKSGTVRTGTFFQARLGPLLARLAPLSLQASFLRRYFRLQ